MLVVLTISVHCFCPVISGQHLGLLGVCRGWWMVQWDAAKCCSLLLLFILETSVLFKCSSWLVLKADRLELCVEDSQSIFHFCLKHFVWQTISFRLDCYRQSRCLCHPFSFFCILSLAVHTLSLSLSLSHIIVGYFIFGEDGAMFVSWRSVQQPQATRGCSLTMTPSSPDDSRPQRPFASSSWSFSVTESSPCTRVCSSLNHCQHTASNCILTW